jgi:SAM-dependent methyltransferase
MTEPGASLVEFYRRHGISPVRQDISDLEAHFTRRAGLYRQLGLLPSFLRGRTVLEIGPGSGFNSLYTATLEPSRYVLVEGNPTGVADIQTLFGDFPSLRERIEIVPRLVEDYEAEERFDYVFCEGMISLSGVADPVGLLRAVARFTAPGGVLVITCVDAISHFAEMLRHLLGQLLVDPSEPLDAQTTRLTPVFRPHLSTLAGMSRPHEDWVIDNLLSPASIAPFLSIPTAIAALEGEFEFFGASPHYSTDWRWYKSLTPSATEYSRRGLEQYWQNAHNLLDYRRLFPPRDAAANQQLHVMCLATRDLIRQYKTTRDVAAVEAIRDQLAEVEHSIRAFSDDIADAVHEAGALLSRDPPDGDAVAASRSFGPWFGRGQQYVSFSRAPQAVR